MILKTLCLNEENHIEILGDRKSVEAVKIVYCKIEYFLLINIDE